MGWVLWTSAVDLSAWSVPLFTDVGQATSPATKSGGHESQHLEKRIGTIWLGVQSLASTATLAWD